MDGSYTSTVSYKLLKNSGALLGVEIITKVSSWAFMLYVVNSLGSVDYGRYSFALSLVGILAMLSELGLGTYIVREVSAREQRAQYIVTNAIALKSVLVLGTVLLSCLVISYMDLPGPDIWLVGILGMTVIVQGFSGLLYALFRGLQHSEYQVLPSFVGGGLNVLLGILMIQLGLSAVGVSLALLSSSLVTLVVCGVLARRFVDLGWALDIAMWKAMVRKVFVLGIALTLVGMYLQLDNILLSRWQGDVAVGLYSVVVRILTFAMFVPHAIMGALLPAMSNLHAAAKQKTSEHYSRILHLLIALALPLVITGEIFGDELIFAFLSEEFEKTAALLRPSLLSLPFIFLNMLIFNRLIVLERYVVLARMNLLGVTFNWILDYIVIANGHWESVPMVALFVQVGVCVIGLYLLNGTGVSISLSQLFRILSLGLLMTTVMYGMRGSSIASILIGLVVYLVGLAILNPASIRSTIVDTIRTNERSKSFFMRPEAR